MEIVTISSTLIKIFVCLFVYPVQKLQARRALEIEKRQRQRDGERLTLIYSIIIIVTKANTVIP